MKVLRIISLFLAFFIGSINAKISIDIETSANSSDIKINYSGSDSKVISEHEIKLFKVDQDNLKEACTKKYGRRPSGVYLKSPTPWGDLYKTYKWEQVKRIITVKSARVKGITKKPTIILSQDFENSFNNTIKVNTGISQTVENSFSTSWTKTKEIAVTEELDFDINFLLAKLTGTTSFSYTTSWGKSEERSESITIGASSNIETELQPGQKATAILTATQGYLEVEVIYKSWLRGNAAVNFRSKLNGHHFWGPSIEKLMKAGGISNEQTATEIIRIGFYVDATLKVIDKVSGKPL
ncbi:hypothetical protein NE865_09067 [Phthorimaea operculella]|nr:hypothetical protein NE865_09067 [Phthorimaea operculella]